MMSFGWYGGFIMFIFWGGLIALVIWGISRIARNDSKYLPPQNHLQSPKEILDIRYAKGEITKEEYEQTKVDLGL